MNLNSAITKYAPKRYEALERIVQHLEGRMGVFVALRDLVDAAYNRQRANKGEMDKVLEFLVTRYGKRLLITKASKKEITFVCLAKQSPKPSAKPIQPAQKPQAPVAPTPRPKPQTKPPKQAVNQLKPAAKPLPKSPLKPSSETPKPAIDIYPEPTIRAVDTPLEVQAILDKMAAARSKAKPIGPITEPQDDPFWNEVVRRFPRLARLESDLILEFKRSSQNPSDSTLQLLLKASIEEAERLLASRSGFLPTVKDRLYGIVGSRKR